jgi:hypothetical protein
LVDLAGDGEIVQRFGKIDLHGWGVCVKSLLVFVELFDDLTHSPSLATRADTTAADLLVKLLEILLSEDLSKPKLEVSIDIRRTALVA